MSFLVDTDICSAYLKGNHRVWQQFMRLHGRLHVSTVTVGELYTWALRTTVPAQRLADLQGFLSHVSVLDLDVTVARKFGEIRAALFDAGTPRPALDLFNAATALAHGLVMATHKVQDFAGVPGLSIEDWLAP